MEDPICSKCKINPRADAEGSNPWCKECRAKYQKEYQATLKEKANGKGYAEGARAMRELVCEKLYVLGGSMVQAYEVARFVRDMELPQAKT